MPTHSGTALDCPALVHSAQLQGRAGCCWGRLQPCRNRLQLAPWLPVSPVSPVNPSLSWTPCPLQAPLPSQCARPLRGTVQTVHAVHEGYGAAPQKWVGVDVPAILPLVHLRGPCLASSPHPASHVCLGSLLSPSYFEWHRAKTPPYRQNKTLQPPTDSLYSQMTAMSSSRCSCR